MFDMFRDALGAFLQLIADAVVSGFHFVFDPLIAAYQSVASSTAQYTSVASSVALPYLAAAEEWVPVSYMLFLLAAYFVIALAFFGYKIAMKIVPHFGQ